MTGLYKALAQFFILWSDVKAFRHKFTKDQLKLGKTCIAYEKAITFTPVLHDFFNLSKGSGISYRQRKYR